MKKILALFLLAIVGCVALFSCGGDEEPITYYSVEFDSNGAEKYTARELADGSLIIEPQQPVRGGYYFTGWYYNDELWDFEKNTVKNDMTLVAGWKRVTYAVSFDLAGGTGIAPDSMIPSGDPVSAPANPVRDGYSFLGWYYEGSAWNFDVDPVLNNMTLTAMWEEITLPVYKVTFDSDGGTAVASKSVTEGDLVTAPASPTKKDHNFLGWYYGGTLYDFTVPVTGDMTLVAVWEEVVIPTYTVTFDSNGGSAVEAQHPVENSPVTRPVAPIYPSSDSEIRVATFLGWFHNGSLYDFATPVTSDITLKAEWQIDVYYKITFEAEGDASYPKTYIIPKGEKVPLLRPTRDDYRFSGWYVGSGSILFDDVNSLPMMNLTLTAAWTPIPTYKVTFDSNGGSVVAVQTVIEGGYVSAPGVPTRAEHRFDGWYNGSTKWDFNSMTVTAPITLTAKWVEQVRVVFNDVDGTRIYARTVDKGSLIPAYQGITKDGYRFDGWYSGSTLWDFGTMAANDHVVLVPKWVRQYTVTFNTDCDLVVESQTVDEGGYLVRPNTPQRGSQYSFDGWYIEDTEIEWIFVEKEGNEKMPVLSDITLIARWSIMTPPDIFTKD